MRKIVARASNDGLVRVWLSAPVSRELNLKKNPNKSVAYTIKNPFSVIDKEWTVDVAFRKYTYTMHKEENKKS